MKKISAKSVKIIIAVIVAIAIIVPPTAYCIYYKENPAQMLTDVFKSNEEQIVGKWQHDSKATAYEFRSDGTCFSHISVLKTSCEYRVEGNKLYLTNSNVDGTQIVFKISVNESRLEMTRIQENGIDVPSDEQETWVYKKVNKINTQRLDQLFYGAKKDAENNSKNE